MSAKDLRARIAELEEQLKEGSAVPLRRDDPDPPTVHGVPIPVVGALAGTALIATPLAFITVRRWWRWWNT